MLLSNITKILNVKKVYNLNNKNNFFNSITSNSQLTNNRTILIYNKDSKVKKKYVKEAIKNKIPAIISNKYLGDLNIPQFIVDNLHKESELLLSNLFKKLPYKSVAITGTNGKTSVVWFISKILSLLDYKNATVGTLGYYINGKKNNEINLTTPSFEELYKYGYSRKIKKNIFIFEASSHALHQNRIRNYPINIAAITNISNDHLDYHKTISNYKKAKMKLFTKHLDKNGFAIINKRMKNISTLKKQLIKKGININYFGKNHLFFEKQNKNLKLIINKKEYTIKNLKLETNVELENLECAVACCLALKINIRKIISTLPFINNPPGRLQVLNYKKKNSRIIIDYAHTPDALKRTLQSLKSKNLKPVLLFGCGGQRDKIKRKLMGIIASNFASRVYITDDNPRNESASKIRKNIIKYCPNAIEIPNRKNAITRAIKDIKLNETLLIAGKGHEKFQIIKNKRLNFDDTQIVKSLLKL